MASVQTDRLAGLTGGRAVKDPVLVASTGNLTLSSSQTIDGIGVSTGRVLAKDQTAASENGIYDVDSGAWSRANDFNGKRDVVRGTVVYVSTGTANGNLWFGVSSTGGNVPGTDTITWEQAAGLTTTNQLTGVLNTNANAINESEGSAVASASTTNVWATDGNTVHITGTVNIDSFSTAPRIGARRTAIFDGALTLLAGGNLILPSSTDITTAAGDVTQIYADSTVQMRLDFFPADGRPVTQTGLNEVIETVSSGGAVVLGSGVTIVSTDSTSGMAALQMSAPVAGAFKEILFAGSATALSIDTSATTILFLTTGSSLTGILGTTTISLDGDVNRLEVGGHTLLLRGLSATVWQVVSGMESTRVSS